MFTITVVYFPVIFVTYVYVSKWFGLLGYQVELNTMKNVNLIQKLKANEYGSKLR